MFRVFVTVQERCLASDGGALCADCSSVPIPAVGLRDAVFSSSELGGCGEHYVRVVGLSHGSLPKACRRKRPRAVYARQTSLNSGIWDFCKRAPSTLPTPPALQKRVGFSLESANRDKALNPFPPQSLCTQIPAGPASSAPTQSKCPELQQLLVKVALLVAGKPG